MFGRRLFYYLFAAYTMPKLAGKGKEKKWPAILNFGRGLASFFPDRSMLAPKTFELFDRVDVICGQIIDGPICMHGSSSIRRLGWQLFERSAGRVDRQSASDAAAAHIHPFLASK